MFTEIPLCSKNISNTTPAFRATPRPARAPLYTLVEGVPHRIPLRFLIPVPDVISGTSTRHQTRPDLSYYIYRRPYSYWGYCIPSSRDASIEVRILYLDNFYTPVPLLLWLRHDLKIGGCGTAKPSSALFPSELQGTKPDIGMHGYHALKVAVVKDVVFKWRLVLTWRTET